MHQLQASKRASHNGTFPFISGSVLDKGTAVAHPLPGRCVQNAVGESRGSFTKQKKEHGQEMYGERYVGNGDSSSTAEPSNAVQSVRRKVTDIANLPHVAVLILTS